MFYALSALPKAQDRVGPTTLPSAPKGDFVGQPLASPEDWCVGGGGREHRHVEEMERTPPPKLQLPFFREHVAVLSEFKYEDV